MKRWNVSGARLWSFFDMHLLTVPLRIVSLFDSTETEIFALVPMVAHHYPAAYETLLRGAAIKCASTGTTFSEVPPPSVVILDVFALPQLQATRSMSGTKIPIFMFISSNSAAIIRVFCPGSMGGRGDLGARTDAEALRVGKTANEVADQVRWDPSKYLRVYLNATQP
jgi:hypothetical protein